MNKLPTKEIPIIPVQEWEKICSESESANKLLNNSDFSFLRDYLNKAKESVILMVSTNSVKDVLETQVGDNGYSKTIKTTKEEQLNEIAGCIKFIDKLFADLKILSNQEAEYLKLADEKKLIIGVSKEDVKSEI